MRIRAIRYFAIAVGFLCSTLRFSAAQSVPSNPILWLQANKGVILEQGHVAVWQDQSGHSNDAYMNDSNSRPDLLIDSGGPAIKFNGWNYLQGPNIFPANSDYTIAVVAKLDDSTAINNLVSGYGHALYFANNSYPRVVHKWFQNQEVSPISVWHNGFSVITATYSQSYQQAALYVNGQFADSSYILSNIDSTFFVGTYQKNYFLHGEIEEILLYPRELVPPDRDSLDNYLLHKYAIAPAAPLPGPDSTFALVPKQFQLYGRGADDSASVPVIGTIYTPGFDSIYAVQFKNGIPVMRKSQPLNYNQGRARFGFSFRIHAELTEYRFDLHLVRGAFDSLLTSRDSIVCGDIFLMDGQSNAYMGFQVDTFRNEFCRTFGVKGSQNLRDTNWGLDYGVGAAASRIQQDLLFYDHMPSCCINESLGGTNIESHERNDSDFFDLRTMYGRELYRTVQAGLDSDVHAMFWLQGESNYAPGYYNKFLKLYQNWHQDYPDLQKIYLLQIRPNYCTFGNIDMRDVQRWMGDSLHDVEPIAAAALPFQDGCHYYDSGYRFMGDRFYLSLARDFYHATDTSNLRSPNAIWAWWTQPDHHQIAVLFSPSDAIVHATDDTTIDGIFATLKDYLYPDDTNSHVESVAFDKDTLFMNLDVPGKTQSIAYLPDQWYNGSDTAVYEGPWIENQRGLGALLWYRLPIANQPFSGVSEVSKPIDFTLAPNPSSGPVTADASALTGPVQATLISETGAVVWQRTLPPDHPMHVTFNFSAEPSGIYVLQLRNEMTLAEHKFILER